CSDSFGTRAPATGGTALGTGTAAVAYSQALAGLTPGATYYYCAIASSVGGTSFGAVMSFTTSEAPEVTSLSATSVSSAAATLQGSADPNGAASTGWFRYSATNPGSCSDSFGTRAPTSGGTALGAGTSAVPYSQALTGLAPATTYYYCAIASSTAGIGFGAVLSLTTTSAPAAPDVTSEPATAVSSTGATIHGSADPNGTATTGWLRYSTTDPVTCSDTFGVRAPASGGSALGAGTSAVAYSQTLAGLTPGTTYYYCALASSSAGTGVGAVLSFTTSSPPSVSTDAATAISSTAATLNGSASPNGTATTGWFRYHTSDPGTCNDTFGTRAPMTVSFALGDGSGAVPYSQTLTGLSAGTTYYFCAIASNAAGTRFGAVLSFTAPSGPSLPAVTSEAATDVTSTSLTLNGSVNPNFAATTAWFRYSATDPVACDDAFGMRAPSGGGASIGAGSSAVPYAEAITGLAPATTYYFCAIASNAVGTSFGELLTVTTAAEPPIVTTTAPTDVTDDAAVLNGSAIANGEMTTGWFRYDTTEPASCDDSFGVRAPATGGLVIGDGVDAVAFAEMISGLTPGSVYYYCAIAVNAQGMAFGEIVSFSPGVEAPVVITEASSEVDGTSATIAGTADPNGSAAIGWFRYGDFDPGACDDAFGSRAPMVEGIALGAGTEAAAYTAPLTGLEPSTTYYYCAAASNLGGASFGEVLSFTTDALPPVVRTVEPVVGMMGAVTLGGAADPRGAESTGWLRYGAVDPGACDDSFGTRAPAVGGTMLGAGRAEVAFSEAIAELAPGTYYVCAIASNEGGIAFGEVMSFEVVEGDVVTGGGCGCRVGSRSSGASGMMLALVALALIAVRRRRR
nr:fibronectin type III domain-containing protein [Myxococcota bacterium]